MARGYFALVLHAHLPFVRHPEDPTVMEELWLKEAITETYLPLLRVFEGLAADGVPFRATLSLSAPLIAMLGDELLRERAAEHIDRLIELAVHECERYEKNREPHYRRLAEMYLQRFRDYRHTWDAHQGDLLRAFRMLYDQGVVELITSTATHGFFPLMDRNWPAMRAQVQVAADQYEQCIGGQPPGMWLGECGYVPGVDELLRERAIRYFFVDSHGIQHADPPPRHGVYAPLYCPSGVASFGRDPETTRQVWSAQEGYPGDSQYRDFYRDIGFDLPLEVIGPWLPVDGHRTYTGLKYHAITHEHLHDKWVYDPEVARGRAAEHAGDFLRRLAERADSLASGMEHPPILVSPYDAELFGHWWYEGPQFLDDLFRKMHFDQDVIEAATPGDFLVHHPTQQVATPAASSWGMGGYNEYWIDESNAWIYRHLHVAAERMVELARRFPEANGRLGRALNQAARELLLAQSSDWPFIMRTGTTVSYAERRVNDHIRRFDRLYHDLLNASVDEAWLAEVEQQDNLFPKIDYRVYAA